MRSSNPMSDRKRHTLVRRAVLGAGLGLVGLLGACNGSSGSSPTFQMVSSSVKPNDVWQINREMQFTFSAPVKFSSVSLNSLSIETATGEPANGVFKIRRIDTDADGLPDTDVPNTLLFQPSCPAQDDLSDAGLQPSTAYRLIAFGRSSGATNVVESVDGVRLTTTQIIDFRTPPRSSAFVDPVPGPPQPVVRESGSSTFDAVSYIECGGDPDERIFFEFDSAAQTYGLSDPAFQAPLNLYSDPDSVIAVYIEFNQPVSPFADNINQTFLGIEFNDGIGGWKPIDTRVELLRNCTVSGATVRLEPVGILPVASMVRAVIRPGFQDIDGNSVTVSIDQFGVSPTRRVEFTSLTPAEDSGDEFREEFLVGGNAAGSNEDTTAIFDTPVASWSGGALTAGFAFQGTGGSATQDFDWVIPAGTTVVFDTNATQIVGGPGGVPAAVQNSINGFVDVRDLIIEEGAILRIQGPKALCVNAARNVIILGTLDVSGFRAKDVASLNTGNQPEVGGVGVAGGGRGGNASQVINSSTPRGGNGNGPFLEEGVGGQGGESGYNPSENVERRRPGGGGAGRFAADVTDATFGSLIAEPGADGNSNATGVITGMQPPLGGSPGNGPFVDGDPNNDFWGVRAVRDPMTMVVDFVRGELEDLHAGYGGGGGGDALKSNQFPTPNWSIGSDEKGGGGGGGGGGVHIKALDQIIFGEDGTILCRGGQGGTGENTNFLDHIGGGGGGGSGGHVVLETATKIDFTNGSPAGVDFGENPFLDEEGEPLAGGRPRIRADGGPGATIGANQLGNGATNPPGVGYGGHGGPGVIQLHVPDPTARPGFDPNTTDIVVPLAATFAGDSSTRDILRSVMAPAGTVMVPTFGARSRARSKWITLGAADQAEDGSTKPVKFYFDGTDPMTGRVLTDGEMVDELDPLLGPEEVVGNPNVGIGPVGDELIISGASLDPLVMDASDPSLDVYLRTPELLENYILRMDVVENPSAVEDYDITAASYNDLTTQLNLHVNTTAVGRTLQQFVDGNFGLTVRYTLVPRFFRIVTNGQEGLMPDGSFVRILFEGTGTNDFGEPDEDDIVVPFTADIAEFNAAPAGAIKFFRFEVEFDLDEMSEGVSLATKPVMIDFLRVPFRF